MRPNAGERLMETILWISLEALVYRMAEITKTGRKSTKKAYKRGMMQPLRMRRQRIPTMF